MRNKSKFLIVTSLVFILVPVFALATFQGGWHPATNYGNTGLPGGSIVDIIEGVMMWILSMVGLFGVIAFAISGIQYLTSAGDEKLIEIAKRNMKWSIMGVIVALSGVIIIQEVTALMDGECDWWDILCLLGL